jgi:inhibitor of KinA
MGDQSAVYPMERPGGWWLIGRTPLEFVNVEERFFPLEVGDTVEFFAVSEAEAREFVGRRLEAAR